MRLLTALLASTFAVAAQGAETWVQLTPAGQFAARDGRPGPGKSWTINDELGARLAAEFTATAGKTPIVVDYDHQTLYVQQHGQKAVAAGWMKAAEWRPGQGFFARTEWTAAAAEHIKSGEYRFISPVLMYDQETFEVRGIAMAALVNFPALLGMHPAIAQLATQFTQEKDSMNPILAALLAGLGLAETATLEQAQTALATLKARPAVPVALATALKLSAGADEAAALAALTQLQRPAIPAGLAAALKIDAGADEAAALAALAKLGGTPDAATMAAMAALQGELAMLRNQVNGDKAVSTVDDAIKAGKLIPAQRDWALNLARTNMAALTGYLDTAPVMAFDGQSKGKERAGSETVDAALAAQVMGQFGLTAEQFAKGAPAKA
jgi:phage I-like protein